MKLVVTLHCSVLEFFAGYELSSELSRNQLTFWLAGESEICDFNN